MAKSEEWIILSMREGEEEGRIGGGERKGKGMGGKDGDGGGWMMDGGAGSTWTGAVCRGEKARPASSRRPACKGTARTASFFLSHFPAHSHMA